jgi:PAS domain S-box-containing protein
VVLAPPESPLRERTLALLTQAGMPVVATPSYEVDLAIVDLTGPEGHLAKRALLDGAPRLGLLAIAEPDARLETAVLEVVSPAALELELIPRVGRLRARLATLQEAQQRQRDLQLLLELTSRFAGSTDVEELTFEVTRRLAEEMGVDRAAIVVVDAERGQGTIVASSDDAGLKDLRIDLQRYPEIREAVRTGKPVIVEDAPSHPLLEDVREAVTTRGIRSIAALPMAVRGKVYGVLLLRRSSERGAFNPREVEFLTAVAHATAVAFRNARALESVRGQREQEKFARLKAEERAADLTRYRAYFDHLSDGVAILDEQARVKSLNPAGYQLLDLATGEALGRHINSLTNPTDDALLLDALLSVKEGRARTDLDLLATTSLGRRLVLNVSAAPLEGDPLDGVCILTFRDVTRQREMADELRKTTEFLGRLIDSSVDAIIAADMKGNVVLFNKAAEAICGWPAAEAIGSLHVTRLYPEGQAREVMQKLRSADFGGPGRLTTTRMEIVSREGERIPVNMSASIIYEGLRETASVGIFTDLRDRLNLERKLSDAETRLHESEKNAVIVALAGTAAHELNQPLTSVMGYAELLKRKLKEEDPAFRPVDIIYREAERMAEIVRRIGKITRYETKAYVGQSKIIDLDKAAGNEE